MTNAIDVSKVADSEWCVASVDGEKLSRKVISALRQDKKIVLSFDNVSALTPAFLNAAVGPIYGEFDENKIYDLFRVDHMSEEDMELLQYVVSCVRNLPSQDISAENDDIERKGVEGRAGVNCIRRYKFSNKDKLFLDNNVWQYIYTVRDSASRHVQVYSDAFKKMLKSGCYIAIDSLVLSEFVNAYARQIYSGQTIYEKDFSEHYARFKNFRNSKDFKPFARHISDTVRNILKHCHYINHDVNATDIEDFISAGQVDFNDLIISDICRKKELTLVTHDADFWKEDLRILTANNELIENAQG